MATIDELAEELDRPREQVEELLRETGGWPDGHVSGEPSISAQHALRLKLQRAHSNPPPGDGRPTT